MGRVEEISDYQKEGDLTLPYRYRLQASIAGQSETVNYEWAFTLSQFDSRRSPQRRGAGTRRGSAEA